MGFYLPEYKPLMDTAVCQPGFSESFFYFPDWASTSLVALLASAFILAFLYMFASMFQNQQSVARVKIELYELIVTAAIFAVLFMMLNGMCSIQTGWIFPGAGHNSNVLGWEDWSGKSIYYSSFNYLMEFADDTLIVMSYQYLGYAFIDFLTSMEISSTPMGIGATMKPTSGLGAVVKPVLNNAFSVEILSVITAQAQVYVMDYGTYGMLKYLLPLALIMRSFTLTRRIGGTIISITIVFLFVYPLLVIPSYMVVNDSLFGSISKYLQGGQYAGVWGASTYFWAVIEMMFKFLWSPDFLFGYALLFMPFIAKIFIGGVFMPLFNTIILTNTAKYLSRSLGEEIDITNLTRMI